MLGITRREREEWQQAVQRRKQEAQRRLMSFGLTCPRCEDLALPLPGTGNRYRCPKCGFQFPHDAHNL